MEWIKRNLLFVVGSVVSVVLMVLAAMYLMSGMGKNDAALEKLNSEYEQLKRLNSQNPHPGDDKIDNIAAAKNQKKNADAVIGKAASAFTPINPIPEGTNVTSAMFAGALRRTIDRMQLDAVRGGVQVPTNFYFSFTAVQNRIMFDQAGLQPLATQLGEVKAICGVLLDARINALDSVRRPKVSTHDTEAQQTADYTTETAVTNEIAVLAPYEVTFRCFSAELAAVLSGYASSPHGLIVRAMNVEPVMGGMSMFGGAETGFAPPVYETAVPTYMPPPATYPAAGANRYADEAVAGNRYAEGNRYGDAGAQGLGGNRYATSPEGGYPATTPVYPTYPTATVPVGRPRVGAGKGGLPTMLDEKQFKVTLLVQVVRLNPKAAE
jgi:hypothetical protein